MTNDCDRVRHNSKKRSPEVPALVGVAVTNGAHSTKWRARPACANLSNGERKKYPRLRGDVFAIIKAIRLIHAALTECPEIKILICQQFGLYGVAGPNVARYWRYVIEYGRYCSGRAHHYWTWWGALSCLWREYESHYVNKQLCITAVGGPADVVDKTKH